MRHAATKEVPPRRQGTGRPMREVPHPAEAAVLTPNHPEARVLPEVPLTLHPAVAPRPAAPSAAVAEVQAQAPAAADVPVEAADKNRQQRLSQRYLKVSNEPVFSNAYQ